MAIAAARAPMPPRAASAPMRWLRRLIVAVGIGAAIAIIFRLYELLTKPRLKEMESDDPIAQHPNAIARQPRRPSQDLISLSSRSLLSDKGADSHRSDESEPKPAAYVAFVSHVKAEAAMEARFLKTELESMFGRCVFLDSDDLRDLSRLVDHVTESSCIIVVQTESVLTRPFCLLELSAAVREGVPIIGVTIEGRANRYSFEESNDFLMHLDTELDLRTPGASETLAKFGIEDLRDLAYRLSSTVPLIISVSLNVGGSSNMLKAAVADLADAMKEATMPQRVPFDEWLRLRAKKDKERLQPEQPACDEGGADTQRRRVAGGGLLERAKTEPALLSVAFLLQGVSAGAVSARHMREDAGTLTPSNPDRNRNPNLDPLPNPPQASSATSPRRRSKPCCAASTPTAHGPPRACRRSSLTLALTISMTVIVNPNPSAEQALLAVT